MYADGCCSCSELNIAFVKRNYLPGNDLYTDDCELTTAYVNVNSVIRDEIKIKLFFFISMDI